MGWRISSEILSVAVPLSEREMMLFEILKYSILLWPCVHFILGSDLPHTSLLSGMDVAYERPAPEWGMLDNSVTFQRRESVEELHRRHIGYEETQRAPRASKA